MTTHTEPMMVERLAHAAAKAGRIAEGYSDDVATEIANDHALNMNYYGAIVRAVLEALKQPSEGMVEAAMSHWGSCATTSSVTAASRAETFTAMIQQILDESRAWEEFRAN